MRINIILALDENNLLGKDNDLPWHYKEDMEHFKNLTLNHAVIMGRKTFESIGKELPQRFNIIVSSTLKNEKLHIVKTFEEGITLARKNKINELFVIGGRSLFDKALPFCDAVYLTRIHKKFNGNIYYNLDLMRFVKMEEEKHGELSFLKYIKVF